MTDYIFDGINTGLISSSGVKVERLPTFYPSAASCVNEQDTEKVMGACIRQQWYRCKSYPESDPAGLYSQYIFAGGNMWEDFLIEQFKRNGLWIGNNIKFAITDRYISGELDIVIKNPGGEKNKAIVESKTYSSANYQAKKEIVGSRDTKPKPKAQNVLQAFIYNCEFADQIDCTYLTYLDRACGGPENNKTFKMTVHSENDRHYPFIETYDFDNAKYSYVDYRISIEGIYDRYDLLMGYLQRSELPDGDFIHEYDEETVAVKWANGEIAKTKYEKWQQNPKKYPIGDWECSYCSYSKLCKAQKEKDGQR